MSEKPDHEVIPSSAKRGLLNGLTGQIKLIFRLMVDPRVSPLLKLLPIGSVVYFLVPDLAPGPIDDVVAVWLGTYLFVELCPPDVVQEHLAVINPTPSPEWSPAASPEGSVQSPDEVIEGEFWEKKS